MTTATIKNRVQNPEFQRYWTMLTSSLAFIISLVTLGGFVFKGGAWMAQTDTRLVNIEEHITIHDHDSALHMPFEKKVETFVTRKEWDLNMQKRDEQLKEIKATSLRTEDKVEKIYDILRK